MLQRLKEMISRSRMDDEWDDIRGSINREEIKKLKVSGLKTPSPHRKSTVKKWACRNCNGSFYYNILRCPMCESAKIVEKIMPTTYHVAMSIHG